MVKIIAMKTNDNPESSVSARDNFTHLGRYTFRPLYSVRISPLFLLHLGPTFVFFLISKFDCVLDDILA